MQRSTGFVEVLDEPTVVLSAGAVALILGVLFSQLLVLGYLLQVQLARLVLIDGTACIICGVTFGIAIALCMALAAHLVLVLVLQRAIAYSLRASAH